MQSLLRPSFLCALLLASACSSETVEQAPTPAPEVKAPPVIIEPPTPKPLEPAGVTFATCSLETGGDDRRAECADVEVPLDWSKPEGAKLKIFVKRIRGSALGAHRQLWLLQGGPGGAGDGLESMAELIAMSNPSLDIYIPDHRGTGRSGRLDCPTATGAAAPSFYQACAAEVTKQWGADGLASFTTTAAARDLGHLVERTRTEGQEVHVYGVSYGTYLAQRYLQLFPKQATAVALDSVCQAGLCSIAKIGYWFDRIGKKYMSECAADAGCFAKLGPDPVAKVREAYAVADARGCAGLNFDGEALRSIFGYFIASVELRALIPATTFRVLRCNSADVTALQKFQNALTGVFGGGEFGPPPKALGSDVLGFNIAFSEMEEDPMTTPAALQELMSDSVFSSYDPSGRAAYEAWPKYKRDEWVGKYPTTTVPVLLMNGTLDPQTPLEFAEAIAPHYTQPAQSFVVFPRAAHGVLYQSPTKPTPPQEPCGMTVWQQFVTKPTAPLDTSCTSRILAHDFDGTPAISNYFFGAPTLWAPPVSPSPGATLLPSGASLAIAKELRRVVHATRPWMPMQHALDAQRRALTR